MTASAARVLAAFADQVPQAPFYGVDSGAVNAYVISSIAAFSLATGALVRFTTPNPNTGPSTANVGGTGDQSIVNQYGNALTGGEITVPTWLQWTGSAWQIVGTGPLPDKARTPTEIANSIVPANYSCTPGALRRYSGADPTGVADSSAAIISASKCNAKVFDDYPGGGQYRIKSTVTLSNFPVAFEGQVKNNGDSSGNTGSLFIIDAALGAGGNAFQASYIDNLNFIDWGFKFATAGNAQFAFRVHTISSVAGQLRSSNFIRCAFVGQAAGDTNCAVRVDTSTDPAGFSAFCTFSECYFDGVLSPMRFTGNCTPNFVDKCSFIGYTGVDAVNSLGSITAGSSYTNGTYANVALTGGAGTGAIAHIQVVGGVVSQVILTQGGTGYAAGNTLSATAASIGGTGSGFSITAATVGAQGGCAIQVDYPGEELKFSACYFEGFIAGVHSNGAALITQDTNEYQVCTYGYVWIQTTYTVIGNQSIGEQGVTGVALGYSSLDGSQMNLAGRLGWLATGGAIQSTRGFQEGNGPGTSLRVNHLGNPLLLGYGDSPGITMGANGGGGISGQITTTWSVSIVGGHLYLDFNVSGTLTGSSTSALVFPLAFFPAVDSQSPCSVTNNGATNFGVAFVLTTSNNLFISLGAAGSGNFTAGAVGAVGQLKVRILS